MDGLLRNCATGCRVDEAFMMDDLVDSISADTSGLRCGHVQLRIVFITPVKGHSLRQMTKKMNDDRSNQKWNTLSQTRQAPTSTNHSALNHQSTDHRHLHVITPLINTTINNTHTQHSMSGLVRRYSC
ncbi:hypothetical protein DPX16_20047 [Anabarilius grahami]|uniref:Uncharacterized protein n=1 Tax=Anabarilius grahami TaxID=495550 RepID=A0A3N0XQR4_ANAGA|nr:hypothetical protein DPX16_20047 [Anabarilius grahami]